VSDRVDSLSDARGFLEMASGIDEASILWTTLADEEPKIDASCIARISTHGFPVTCLRTADGLVAAASKASTQVQLFNDHLSRLPPIRIRGKPLETLDLSPCADHLAIGATDGQVSLYSVDAAEEAPTRLYRVSSSSKVSFAGLHFVSPAKLIVAPAGECGNAPFLT